MSGVEGKPAPGHCGKAEPDAEARPIAAMRAGVSAAMAARVWSRVRSKKLAIPRIAFSSVRLLIHSSGVNMANSRLQQGEWKDFIPYWLQLKSCPLHRFKKSAPIRQTCIDTERR